MERDYGKLRGRVTEKFKTQKAFAEAMGKDLSLVNQTLNDKRDIDQEEIEQWCEVLEISAEEIPAYFFKRKVATGTDRTMKFKELNQATRRLLIDAIKKDMEREKHADEEDHGTGNETQDPDRRDR